MSTGQTILTIGAFMFLTTILMNFYSVVAHTGDTIASGQDGILATTIATSYMEVAQGLSFDQITDTSNIAIANPSVLTSPLSLGHESGEDSVALYNDFDDFNRTVVDKQAMGTNRIYRTIFSVSYVNADNLLLTSTSRTFVKRLDMKTWRVFPVAETALDLDTVRTTLVLGYFHFD
jgi:hypothetical protein